MGGHEVLYDHSRVQIREDAHLPKDFPVRFEG